MNKKALLVTLIITFLLLLLYIPLSQPIEGGLIFIVIGVIWLGVQLFVHSDFFISKSFSVFVVLLIYLSVYRLYAKPIPITDITIQRTLMYLMLIFFMYSSLRQDMDRKLWEDVLIILAIVVSLMSVLEVLEWHSKYSTTAALLQVLPVPQIAYRLKGYFLGHPNPLAGFLNFVWPIIFIRLYNSKEALLKYLWGVILLLLAGTILYTNSRGALLGTFAGSAFIFVAIVLNRGISARKITSLFSQNKKQMAVVLGTLILLALGVLWRSMFTGQFLNRSFSGRGTIWKYSWEAFQENPVFGQGMGAFPISYTRLAQLPPGDFAPSAHNLWLQLSVDYGILGFIFICVLMSVFLYFSVKTLKEQSIDVSAYQIAYIAGGIAFLAQHTVDYLLITVNYLVISLIILVFLLKYVVSLGEWHLNRRYYALVGLAVIGMLSAYEMVISSQVMSSSDYTEQLELADNDEWILLEEEICLSADKYPDNALYKFECAAAVIHQISPQYEKDMVTFDAQALDKAIFYQQAGYDLNPYWAIQEANLAVLYWGKGDQSKAISLMEHAVSSAPMLDILLLNLGWMEEEVGNKEAAIVYYTRVLRLNPMINLSNFSQQSVLFNKAAQDLSTWGESEELWDYWYDNARHDRGTASRDREYWKGVIALSTGQYKLAITHFENRLASNVLGNPSPNLYAYLAYAYQLDGQSKRAYLAAKDVVLLTSSELRGVGGLAELSIVASILRENGESDLAYRVLVYALEKTKTRAYQKYYPAIYTQQIMNSDVSPWLIRNQIMLIDTQADWTWLVDEALRKGDTLLAESVAQWLEELHGIAIR